jgi:hypothetical protein
MSDAATTVDPQMWLRNASEIDFQNQKSPSGLPLTCCRVRTIGQAPQNK